MGMVGEVGFQQTGSINGLAGVLGDFNPVDVKKLFSAVP